MTREEAIKELSYITDEMPSNECADWKKAIYMAIEALEKEPILDKIRTEIAELPKMYSSVNHLSTYVNEKDVMKIIDKYKIEK